jgi:hypothetical protein
LINSTKNNKQSRNQFTLKKYKKKANQLLQLATGLYLSQSSAAHIFRCLSFKSLLILSATFLQSCLSIPHNFKVNTKANNLPEQPALNKTKNVLAAEISMQQLATNPERSIMRAELSCCQFLLILQLFVGMFLFERHIFKNYSLYKDSHKHFVP